MIYNINMDILPNDYMIEEFWLNFKVSMNNFYTVSKIPPRPIEVWSNELNWLQCTKDYNMIENNIRNYISLYSIDVIRYNVYYHFGILYANIKRWNIISNDFKINDTSKYHNIVFLLIDLYQSLNKKTSNINNKEDNKEINDIFSMIELYIIYEDFTHLVKFAIDTNRPSILDKINKYSDVSKYIESLYKIKITKMSGKKILDLINKKI